MWHAHRVSDRGPAPPPPALVCVPGLGLDARAWTPTLVSLPEHPAQVALLPGFGLRPHRGDAVDPRSLGQRLADQWLAGRSDVVLLGHSASCQVVVEAAAAAPDAVASVVLVGPTTDPRGRSWPALLQRWLRTAVHETPRQAPVLARTYGRVGPLPMLRTMDAARAHDLRTSLRRLSCPVLVVRGPRDRICPADWASEVARSAPEGAPAVTLATGAHMVPLTHGPWTSAAVRTFLHAGTLRRTGEA